MESTGPSRRQQPVPLGIPEGGVRELRRVALARGTCELVVSAGSVLNFGGGTDWSPDCIAIVNAASCGGLGGGGVDGAITRAGGPELAAARLSLPVLAGSGSAAVRIQTGGSVLTSVHGCFGRLNVGNVVHTVGPDYRRLRPDQTPEDGDRLLRNAYQSAMSAAAEAGIQFLGFSLLSAGIFRGMRTLEHVLGIGVEVVRDCAYEGLREVHLIAFQPEEQQVLLDLVSELCCYISADVDIAPSPGPSAAAVSTDVQVSTMLPAVVAACQEYEEHPRSGLVERAVFDAILKMLELDLVVQQSPAANILVQCTTSGMVAFHRFAELHAQQELLQRRDRADRLDDIHKEIVGIYTLHNPHKLRDVDQLLAEWAGNEEDLLSRIQEKYNPKSPMDGMNKRPTATDDLEEPEPSPHSESSTGTVCDTQSQHLRETFGTLKEVERRSAREHPKYINSAEVEACMQCERQFGLIFGCWQHTCRYCGWVVCHNCSSNTLKLNRWIPVHGRGPMTPLDKLREQEPPVAKRVCDSCYQHAPREMERRREQKRLRQEQAALKAEEADAHERQEVYALQEQLAAMKLQHLTDEQTLSELKAAAADEQTKHARQEAEIAAAAAEAQHAIAQEQRAKREAAFHKTQAAQLEREKTEQERLEVEARLQRERDAKVVIEEKEQARQMEAMRISAEGKHLAQLALTNQRRQEVARQAAEAAAVEAELHRVAAEHQRAEMEAALLRAQAAQHEQEIAEQERVETEAKLHREHAAKAALADAQAATQAERQRLLDEQAHLEQLRINLQDRKQVAKQKAVVAADEAATLRLLARQQSEAAEAARQRALAAQHKLGEAEDEAREAQHQQATAKAKALALEQEENATKTHAENEARERRIARNAAQAAAESRAKMQHLQAAAQDRLKWERGGPDEWIEYSEHDSRALSEQYVALQLRTLLAEPVKTERSGQSEDRHVTNVVRVEGWVDLTTFSHIVVTQPGILVAAMPGLDDFVPVGRWGRATGLKPGQQGEPADPLGITSKEDCIDYPLEITWDDDGSTESFTPVFSSVQESVLLQCPRRLLGCSGLFQLLDKVRLKTNQGSNIDRHNALHHGATGIVVGSTVADDGGVRIRVHLDASFAGEVALKPENLVRVQPAENYSVRGFSWSGTAMDAALPRPSVDAFLTPRRCEDCAGVFGQAEGIDCRSQNCQAAPLTMKLATVGMAVHCIDSSKTNGQVSDLVNICVNASNIIDR